ncbi:hypothetical protein Tco_0761211 [Tanacetum coccineum]
MGCCGFGVGMIAGVVVWRSMGVITAGGGASGRVFGRLEGVFLAGWGVCSWASMFDYGVHLYFVGHWGSWCGSGSELLDEGGFLDWVVGVGGVLHGLLGAVWTNVVRLCGWWKGDCMNIVCQLQVFGVAGLSWRLIWVCVLLDHVGVVGVVFRCGLVNQCLSFHVGLGCCGRMSVSVVVRHWLWFESRLMAVGLACCCMGGFHSVGLQGSLMGCKFVMDVAMGWWAFVVWLDVGDVCLVMWFVGCCFVDGKNGLARWDVVTLGCGGNCGFVVANSLFGEYSVVALVGGSVLAEVLWWLVVWVVSLVVVLGIGMSSCWLCLRAGLLLWLYGSIEGRFGGLFFVGCVMGLNVCGVVVSDMGAFFWHGLWLIVGHGWKGGVEVLWLCVFVAADGCMVWLSGVFVIFCHIGVLYRWAWSWLAVWTGWWLINNLYNIGLVMELLLIFVCWVACDRLAIAMCWSVVWIGRVYQALDVVFHVGGVVLMDGFLDSCIGYLLSVEGELVGDCAGCVLRLWALFDLCFIGFVSRWLVVLGYALLLFVWGLVGFVVVVLCRGVVVLSDWRLVGVLVWGVLVGSYWVCMNVVGNDASGHIGGWRVWRLWLLCAWCGVTGASVGGGIGELVLCLWGGTGGDWFSWGLLWGG